MWPAERPDLRARVLWASFYLVLAKLLTVGVPYFYKWATDALDGDRQGLEWLPLVLAGAITLVVAYNVARVVSVGFNQLRDALFARVGQYAVRRLAYQTFVQMHALSLRFHLERRTGGLSRIIERGTKGIETIVRFTILNSVPTLLEFLLTAIIFGVTYGTYYVLVVALTVVAYSWFTVKASDWRIGIRREMNDSDTEANTKAIDSLLNFETVKYFGNELMEADRFDRSMARYESAATKTWTSLGWLNFGQGVIFALGMGAAMVMSAREVQAGTQTLGDFVFINALLMQLSIPLNFIGFVYREIRQGLTDMEEMFNLLSVRREVQDDADAPPLRWPPGPSASRMCAFPTTRGGRSSRASASRYRRGARSRSSAHPGRANPPSRASCSGSTTCRRGASPSTGRTSRMFVRTACGPPSASFRRIRCCSTTRSPTTSATGVWMPPMRRCAARPSWRRSTTSSKASRRATTRWSASAG